MLLFAFSAQDQVEKYGAYVGIAAFLGLAVLSLLYFSQARELKRLREWAGRAPERARELEHRVVAQATATVARRPPRARRRRPPGRSRRRAGWPRCRRRPRRRPPPRARPRSWPRPWTPTRPRTATSRCRRAARAAASPPAASRRRRTARPTRRG